MSAIVETHHPLSMSRAERFFACPGSVEATKDIPDRPGKAALFGTKVHRLLEALLKEKFSEIVDVDQEALTIAETAKEALIKLVPENSTWLVEEKVTLPIKTTKFPPISGTLDVGAWKAMGALQVIDLKTGFKSVEPEGNKQLLGYALGAFSKLTEFEQATIDKVELRILQLNEAVGCVVKLWELSVEELQTRWLNAFQEAVNRIEQNPDLRIAGPHCTDTYCPAAPTCPVFKLYLEEGMDMKLDEIQAPYKPNQEVSVDHLAKWLNTAEILEDLIKQIKELALSRALDGEVIPGRKLIKNYGHKKWIEEKEVIKQAKAAGVLDKIQTLKTPAQVAKTVKAFDIQKLWAKPEIGWKLIKDTNDLKDLGDLD